MRSSTPAATPRTCSARPAMSAMSAATKPGPPVSSAPSAAPSASSPPPMRIRPSAVAAGVADGDRAADEQRVRGDGAFHVADQLGQRADGVEGRHAAGAGGLPEVEDATAEADAGGAQLVRLDAQRVRVDAVGAGAHHQRGASGPAGGGRRLLGDQAGGGEVRGERADGAAVEAEPGGQLRPGGRTVHVDVAQHGAEVQPADLLLAGARRRRHGERRVPARPGDSGPQWCRHGRASFRVGCRPP